VGESLAVSACSLTRYFAQMLSRGQSCPRKLGRWWRLRLLRL